MLMWSVVHLPLALIRMAQSAMSSPERGGAAAAAAAAGRVCVYMYVEAGGSGVEEDGVGWGGAGWEEMSNPQ